MNLSIKNSLYQAILQNKWLDISYVNKNNEHTYYYIGIKDINIEKGIIFCDIFNPSKDLEVLSSKNNIFIYINRIERASILESSFYEGNDKLIYKINNDRKFGEFFDILSLDNSILNYLSSCYRFDNDPYLKDIVMIDGIDIHTLSKCEEYKLSNKQFDEILNKVFKSNNVYDSERINRYKILAINKFSIDINNKQYVVAYKLLKLDFKNKVLKISKNSSINKAFLIDEDKRVTLNHYLDINPEEFVTNFDKNEKEYIEMIKGNFHHGEKVNTRPTIFFLMINTQKGVEEAFDSIYLMDKQAKLTVPLKAFFGRNKSRNKGNKEVNIVVSDKNKINVDQMRVVYNSLINHVTYVKGPPGTGKTETIFNCLLSSYANERTVLVCSNNNHPINDIFKKMNDTFNKNNDPFDNSKKIYFPMIRLGNNNELKETIYRLQEILQYTLEHDVDFKEEDYLKLSKNNLLSNFEKLKLLLSDYENKIDLKERVNTLNKIRSLTTIKQINDKLEQQIKTYNEELNSFKEVKNEDVLECALSASSDENFKKYMYFSSLFRFRKLLSITNKELREIILNEDIEKAVVSFNKWLKDDSNLKRLISIFPIVLCTNLSSEKLGSPKPHFDLVIMDEAGQCNIATSLISIVRGNNLLLVGDTNQLQPVTVIEESLNESLMKKYQIKKEYDYVHNSILSLMLRKDNNSKNILLRYHYRCGKKIIGFVNNRFYENLLEPLNKNKGDLAYFDVENTYNPAYRNSYIEEAKEIAKIIKENDYKDVGIITPFVNQACLINDYLKEFGINDVKAGTIHTLQGSEKSVIIMSSALSLKTGKKTMDWIKNNHELINVGVTRAKDKFIFVGDKKAIDLLSKNEKNDIKVLSDYVYENGEIVVPKCETNIQHDFSNNSLNEKEFFTTIKPYFNRRGSKFKIERNILVKDAIKDIKEDDYKLFGKKEFDVIVQVNGRLFNRNKYHTIVAFELDGGEHILNNKTIMLDRQKEEICKFYGIKLIRISNDDIKDYESIISLFEFVVKDLDDIEEAYNQVSLFED